MAALAAIPIFLLAGLGVFACALQGLRYMAMALNPHRPVGQRRVRGLIAALFGVAMVASAAAGYLGIVSLMYYAQS